MTAKTNYSLLVNTTDSFEDCWNPFFTLFARYWPQYSGTIYLNTETKSFTFPNLNIKSIKNNDQTPSKKISWSECLIQALKDIDNEVILYMQEDYFIKDTVNNDLVEKYAALMNANKDIHCIHLTDQAVEAENFPSQYEGLLPVVLNQRYRISCQAALWRKEVLYSYLRSYENAWQFEEFGSKRGTILKHNFYVVDRMLVKLDEIEIIPYIFTGIIQGRWYEAIVPLFQKNGIIVDYSNRGFYQNGTRKSKIGKLRYQWQRIPILIKNFIDLRKLKNRITIL